MRIAYLALIELDVPNACLIHTREITEQMVNLGHEVELFLPQPLQQQVWWGVHHHWVHFWGFDPLRRFCFQVEACARLWWQHRNTPFDCLYLREMEASELLVRMCGLLSLPLFVEVNGWLLDDLGLMGANKDQKHRAQRSQRQLMRAACGVIASTVGNAHNVKHHYDVRCVMTQELGVNGDLFSSMDQSQSRQKLNIADDATIILFAGSFHPHHDLFTLINAFASVHQRLPSVRLVLLGEGAQWQQAELWVREAGVASMVDCVGGRPYEEMPCWFSAADLLVSPLIAQKITQQNGALATKIWEAMAAGTRVLLTDFPDSASYSLLSPLAWITPPEDVAAMADGIVEALSVQDGREMRAQTYVLQQRSWKKAAQETLLFMRQCLEAN
ncbi:MAG: glycosyltransferase family 4 protein [Mariprofundales bacterium]